MPMNEYGEIIRNSSPPPPIPPTNNNRNSNNNPKGSGIALVIGIAILVAAISLLLMQIKIRKIPIMSMLILQQLQIIARIIILRKTTQMTMMLNIMIQTIQMLALMNTVMRNIITVLKKIYPIIFYLIVTQSTFLILIWMAFPRKKSCWPEMKSMPVVEENLLQNP